MADPDGNSPAPNEPTPTPLPAKPVAPAPRVNPPNINAGKEKTAAPGGPPGFNDFMEWMRSQVAGESVAADQRTTIPRERKKFQRQDVEARGDKPPAATPEALAAPVAPAEKTGLLPVAPAAPLAPAAPSTGPSVPAVEAVRPPPETSGSAEPPARVRRGHTASTKRYPWIALLASAATFGLLVVSFLLGRASMPKVGPAPPAAPAAPEVTTQDGKTTINLLSKTNATLIDQAMALTQGSKFKEATEALDKVKASGERVRGLSLQLALLASFANENTRALPLLNEAISEGDDLAEAYNLRATLGVRQAVFRNGGMDDYETAAKLAPFDARVFFYWGAALRRAGKSQEAIKRLQQAIDRLREPTAEGLYRLSLRLTQLEVGQDKEFADELTRQLALPHPNIDWLFTAAALALRDAKYDAAASYLDRAEACGDPDGFALRMRDFYIRQSSTRKELARFFAKLVPAKPAATSAPEASAPPMTGLEVPTLPPPASPGATVAR